jgi:hypothetical protein
MKQTKKVATPQALAKDMKPLIGLLIEKALKPVHKQLSDLQEKLKALKMDKGAPKKANTKKAMKGAEKPKASKAKSKKTKMLKDIKPKA